jgi:hypothetical protein
VPKVSELPDASFPLSGNEDFVFNQDSIGTRGPVRSTVRAALSDIFDDLFPTVSAARSTRDSVLVPGGTFQEIVFAGIVYDTAGYWSDSAPAVFTVPFDGLYSIGGSIEFAGNDTTSLRTRVGVISAQGFGTVDSVQFYEPAEGLGAIQPLSGDCTLQAGATVSLSAKTFGDDETATGELWISYRGGLAPPPPPPPPPPVNALAVSGTDTFSVTGSDFLLWFPS